MTRCAPFASLPALVLVLALALPAAAQAPLRNFPATALRGELRVLQPPEVAINGKPGRLAPGSRIRDANNLLAMSGTLVGEKLVVHYTLDPLGQLLDVWVLTPQERGRQPWPGTPEQAQAWSFNVDAQTWSKP
ncbi:hypothetical protein [Methylibium sp.]|uniref:hypothetical protein n=1 Tax=Methylibium sp. TaxID=2067992 RepID=UPI00286C1166|nr:hypothetical protein [Methylibium sp.]